MGKGILLSKYFKGAEVVAKEDQLEPKPSSKGLKKLKDRLGLEDWEMLYVGDGYDDYLAAKGANVFFAMIAQGLVKDVSTIRSIKSESEFGGSFIKRKKSMLPKFIVIYTYNELWWWLKEFDELLDKIGAVCFDLGDTLIVGGREEAYSITDRNWPVWEVDKLLEERKAGKELREAILSIRIGDKWRKLGDLPGMNSSEVRVSSFFLLELLGLKEKELVSALYSEADDGMRKKAESLGKKTGTALNTKTVPEGATLKELASLFPPEQYSLFVAAGLSKTLEEQDRGPEEGDLSTILMSAFIWIEQYRKHEIDAYREHCKVPEGLGELLDFLVKRGKKLCIFTSKSRKIVETALAYKKEISKH